jgi:riboflavin synthase
VGVRFYFNIFPHTIKETTLGELRVEDEVNIEIDVVARYLDRLMSKTGT